MGQRNLIKPIKPTFSNKPAKITEPTVGASTCAFGNQICTGTIGVLTAKAINNAHHKIDCSIDDHIHKRKVCTDKDTSKV